jgi:hypothetical protein
VNELLGHKTHPQEKGKPRMRRQIIALAALLLFSVIVVGQDSATVSSAPAKTGKAVVITRDIVLPVSVHQPNCPLKLEFATMHGYLDGGSIELSRFRNQGTKFITKYKIAWLAPGGGGGSMEGRDTIAPGFTYGDEDDAKDPFHAEMIPLTNELKESLKIGKGLQGLIYYMVVRLEYDDGSTFDDEATYKALEKYLEKIELPQK